MGNRASKVSGFVDSSWEAANTKDLGTEVPPFPRGYLY